MLKNVAFGVLGSGFVLMSVPAFAGEWRLDPRACPDLVEDHVDRIEDRRDRRNNYGRRDRAEDRWDRRENRRDRAVTICPVRAFYYVPDRHARHRAARADYRSGHYGLDRQPARPPLRFDRRMQMHYRYDNGRKVYVRL